LVELKFAGILYFILFIEKHNVSSRIQSSSINKNITPTNHIGDKTKFYFYKRTNNLW
jgi:hypothetical protein